MSVVSWCIRIGTAKLRSTEMVANILVLAFMGADLSEIMDHVGWSRRHMALYYMQLAKVPNPAGASAGLAADLGTGQVNAWQDINSLKSFLCAFPAGNLAKRPSSSPAAV